MTDVELQKLNDLNESAEELELAAKEAREKADFAAFKLLRDKQPAVNGTKNYLQASSVFFERSFRGLKRIALFIYPLLVHAARGLWNLIDGLRAKLKERKGRCTITKPFRAFQRGYCARRAQGRGLKTE